MTLALVRAEPVDIEDIECKISISRPIFGAVSGHSERPLPRGISELSAEAVLSIYDDESDDSEEHVIARCSGYTIDLYRVGDLLDAVDQIGEELVEVVEEAFSGETILEWLERTDPLLSGTTNQVAVIDHVFVEPPYRGQRIGPRLVSSVLDTVGGTGGTTLALLQAQPVPWEDLSDIALRTAQKKVAKSYESIGFAPFRKRIYWWHTALNGPENLEEN